MNLPLNIIDSLYNTVCDNGGTLYNNEYVDEMEKSDLLEEKLLAHLPGRLLEDYRSQKDTEKYAFGKMIFVQGMLAAAQFLNLLQDGSQTKKNDK